MFVVGNLLIAAGRLMAWAATVYMVIIFLSAAITWFQLDPYHPLVRFLRQVTDPVYDLVRKYLPELAWNNALGVDFTPVLLFLVLWFVNLGIFQSVIELGYRLK
jgi:YggT family protein